MVGVGSLPKLLHCVCCHPIYHKLLLIKKKYHIYEFLVGLNSEYDQIRVQILVEESLPYLREAFAYVQNEESSRGAILHSSPGNDHPWLLHLTTLEKGILRVMIAKKQWVVLRMK